MDEQTRELLITIGVPVLLVLTAVGVLAYRQWLRNSKEQLAREEQNRMQMERMFHMQQTQQAASQQQMDKLVETLMSSTSRLKSENDESFGLNAGGYIIFNMPDSKKALFHDLLKGFEEYAKLRGYEIRFSIDNSITGKVAFKFTLDNVGINVSTKQVKQDLQDFINRVQKGDSLDDLPVVLSPEEHSLLLTCMKNRISFLQHSYSLQRNAAEFYLGVLKQLPNFGSGVSHPQNFYMISGEGSQASSYNALNSPQSIQGAANRLIGNRLDQGIHIANSFNERDKQIRALSSLWIALHEESKKIPEDSPDAKQYATAIKHIQKVETELQEEDQPDPTRIHRWLETAKYSLVALGLTKEVKEAAAAAWEIFKLTFSA